MHIYTVYTTRGDFTEIRADSREEAKRIVRRWTTDQIVSVEVVR